MNLADSRMDCLRGCLATLSVLVVRISLLEYSNIHEKAYKCIVCEFGGFQNAVSLLPHFFCVLECFLLSCYVAPSYPSHLLSACYLSICSLSNSTTLSTPISCALLLSTCPSSTSSSLSSSVPCSLSLCT